MSLINPARFIAAMQRTPIILEGILHGVSQEDAAKMSDGPDGWTVVEIVCHLRDSEHVFYERAVTMLNEDHPTLQSFDYEAMVINLGYNSQNLNNALRTFIDNRRKFIELFDGLTRDEWNRTGVHPEHGVITLLDAAVQVVTHDIDHLQQIVRALELAH